MHQKEGKVFSGAAQGSNGWYLDLEIDGSEPIEKIFVRGKETSRFGSGGTNTGDDNGQSASNFSGFDQYFLNIWNFVNEVMNFERSGKEEAFRALVGMEMHGKGKFVRLKELSLEKLRDLRNFGK